MDTGPVRLSHGVPVYVPLRSSFPYRTTPDTKWVQGLFWGEVLERLKTPSQWSQALYKANGTFLYTL